MLEKIISLIIAISCEGMVKPEYYSARPVFNQFNVIRLDELAGNYLGLYIQPFDLIFVKLNPEPYNYCQVLCHELSHRKFETLTEQEKTHWRNSEEYAIQQTKKWRQCYK